MRIQQQEEIEIDGLSGSDGIAIGPILVLNAEKKRIQPKKIKSSSILEHLKRYTTAKQNFLRELDDLTINLDRKTAGILETQKHIVSDVEIEKMINGAIEINLNSVDFAIYKVFNQFIERLRESGSELFQQRIIDIENIRDRLIELSCEDEKVVEIEKGAILIVKEISPTDLVSYYEKGVAGLVMDRGGITSHATIIAQSLDIPCLVSTKIAVKVAHSAKNAILDCKNGKLYLDPTKERLSNFKQVLKKDNKAKDELKTGTQSSETLDGYTFHLRANIEFAQELELANHYSAEGIGLLRTEALLYGGMAKKSEIEQEKYYESILSNSTGPVVIRLFDVGGDKLNIHTQDEANPFLGWRGIRMLLDEEEMLIGQLKSIFRSSGKHPGRVRILVPMVSILEEIKELKVIIELVKNQLIRNGELIDNAITIGIMIEVPSVALLADHFAKEVDFFSIGTNDLTQYTLAVDRGNEQIGRLYQHHHPAVWQLIHKTKLAADENNIDLSVCGELAGDVIGASCLVGMGINDLSMSPALIPKVKDSLKKRSKIELENFSSAVLKCATHTEVQELYKNWD